MTVFFFDTETTDLPKDFKPANDPCQPQLVQFAGILAENENDVLASVNVLVQIPRGPVAPGAEKAHGISTEKANKFGVSPRLAMELFTELYCMADIVVAHNIKFDAFIVAIHRAHYGQDLELPDRETYCTMKKATEVLNLPPTEKMVASGRLSAKPPRLEECIKFFFDEKLEGAHDALIDVKACMRVYYHLKENCGRD